jgi:uncharacterized membrane protein YkoI
MIRQLLVLLVLPTSAALSQQPTPPQAAPQEPSVTVKAAKPEYRTQAKITPEVATANALARVPGGRVEEAELEKEHGRLVYSFDIHNPKHKGVDEVQVDARSGKVVSLKHESPEAEAREKKSEEHARPDR